MGKSVRTEEKKTAVTGEAAGERERRVVDKRLTWTKGTKYLLDFMFYGGILVTASLPWSIRWIGKQLPYLIEHYEESVIIYFVLGIAAEKLLWELRKIFKTVLAGNC